MLLTYIYLILFEYITIILNYKKKKIIILEYMKRIYYNYFFFSDI